MNQVPTFRVIDGETVSDVLSHRAADVMDTVRRTYLAHDDGDTANPPSYFLRFPDRPDSRIIALPASLGGQGAVDGIKWISSFPSNRSIGVPRASAVLILNDQLTGYPIACMEASIISATRTAASAALAACTLTKGRPSPRRVLYFGAGLVARYTHEYLLHAGFVFDQVNIVDDSPEYAAQFVDRISSSSQVRVHESRERAIRDSDLIVFATTAARPHITDPGWFDHNPVVLHVSLRDLAPEVLLRGFNIVDDVEHCLKADTSPHLAERLTGGRDFVNGVLADVLRERVQVPTDLPVFFSPFGLGVLDLAVGKFVLDRCVRADRALSVPGFFAELSRY